MPTTLKQTETLPIASQANLPRVYGVLPESIDEVWGELEPLVKKVTEMDNLYSTEDIKSLAEKGEIQLWVIYMNEGLIAFVATTIAIYPKSKICRVFLCSGSQFNKWQKLTVLVEDWARSIGCNYMEIIGRPGWEKLFKNYKKTEVTLKRKL